MIMVWGNPKLVSTGRTETHRDSELPNILLIIDTTRGLSITIWNEWIQNPAISRLANEGILFEERLLQWRQLLLLMPPF